MSDTQEILDSLITKATKSGLDAQSRPYNSIEEYTQATGKRFRMTKKQKESGMDRKAAFEEFVSTLKN